MGKETNNLFRLVLNAALLSRQAYVNAQMFDPKGRDIDDECGYPVGDLGADLYWQLYERVSIAQRVVNVYPSECWSVYPELYETEDDIITPFEERWAELNKDSFIWSMLDRIDELSGIGAFGVLFMGFADGANPLTPVPGVGEDGRQDPKVPNPGNELLFMRAFDQSNVDIVRYESDLRNPRYGQPLEYKLNVFNPANAVPSGNVDSEGRPTQQPSVTTTLNVHWSRVIHVADNRKSSEIFGMPRMRPVIPEIFDIRKIRGGSGEMFWRGAFPGYSFEEIPESSGIAPELDREALQEEFEKYSNGLQRYLALTGMTAKSLAPQISPPTQHLDEQYRSIAAIIGTPLRILLGSESGHLASTQDAGTWNRRLGKRQYMYLNPYVISPLVSRMIMTGVLPKPERFQTHWNDLNTLSAKDKADIALKQTQSLMTYVSGGVEQIMPIMEFYINILGMTVAEAVAVVKRASRKSRKMLTTPIVGTGPVPQGGGRNGGDQQGEQGNPGTNPDGSTKE